MIKNNKRNQNNKMEPGRWLPAGVHSMTHPGLRLLIAAALLCVSAASWSTSYVITTTEDVSGEDPEAAGECSLRDALMAINTQDQVNDCEPGTGNDRIRLQPGESYELDEDKGHLQIGGMEDSEGDNVNPRVRFRLDSDGDNAEIVGGSNFRVFWVRENAELTVQGVTLRDGNAGNDNGGLIYAEGDVRLSQGSRLLNGSAANGGAVAMAPGQDFSGDTIMMQGNAATEKGGALYVPEVASGAAGSVELNRFYVAENHAGQQGGGIYFNGQRLHASAGTLALNNAGDGGSALHVASEPSSQWLVLNNLTVASNGFDADGDPGDSGAGVWVENADGQRDSERLLNSVLVGNANDDCGGRATETEDVLYTAFIVSDNCSDPSDNEPPDNVNIGQATQNGTIEVLRGAEGNCTATPCTPADAESLRGGFPGYIPNFEANLDQDGNEDPDKPVLLDAGSPVTAVTDVCTSRDQRGNTREDRCDIGSHEFEKATGEPSSFDITIGGSKRLDVVENDLGDASIDCNRLADPDECIRQVLNSTRNVGIAPEIVEQDDGTLYPFLRYTSIESFDGLDFFAYEVEAEAFDGPTFAGRSVRARVSVSSRPASGLTESKNIDDFSGNWSLGGLLLVLLCGIARRNGQAYRAALALLVLMTPFSLQANEIVVNTDNDAVPFEDAELNNRCSFRGAVDSARENWVSNSNCRSDRGRRDVISLPGEDPEDPDEPFVLSLVDTIEIAQGNRVTVEGAGVDRTIIEGNDAFRLFEANSNITFRNLTLRGGNAGDGGGGAVLARRNVAMENVRIVENQATNGGAFFLDFNDAETRNVRMRRTYFARNHAAGGDGGVLSMVGQTQEHDIQFQESTFFENTADGEGGAFDVNFAMGSTLVITNSVFLDNEGNGGSALDLKNLADGSAVDIVNTTLFSEGGVGVGPIDVGDTEGSVRMSNSIYAGDADDCAGSDGDSSLQRSEFNLFSSPDGRGCRFSLGQENDSATLAEIRDELRVEGSRDAMSDALNSQDDPVVLAADAGEEDREDFYVPPHLAVNPDGPEEGLILNAGNPAPTEFGVRTTSRCRAIDIRRERRPAGTGCDRGSYEAQRTTARDHDARNSGRTSRTALVDVLDGAIAGEGKEILSGTIDVENESEQGGTLSLVRRDAEDELCGEPNGGDITDDCVILYEAPSEIVFDHPDHDGTVEDRCEALPFEDSFDYGFRVRDEGSNDQGEEIDEEARGDVFVSIRNVRPQVPSERRSFHIDRGSSIVINLQATDPDGDDANLTLEVPENARPEFARRGEGGEMVGEGLVLGEPGDMQITYRHASTFQSFKERFSVRVIDECEDSSNEQFEITFPEQGSDQDDVVSGVSQWYMLLMAAMGILRRKMKRQ